MRAEPPRTQPRRRWFGGGQVPPSRLPMSALPPCPRGLRAVAVREQHLERRHVGPGPGSLSAQLHPRQLRGATAFHNPKSFPSHPLPLMGPAGSSWPFRYVQKHSSLSHLRSLPEYSLFQGGLWDGVVPSSSNDKSRRMTNDEFWQIPTNSDHDNNTNLCNGAV